MSSTSCWEDERNVKHTLFCLQIAPMRITLSHTPLHSWKRMMLVHHELAITCNHFNNMKRRYRHCRTQILDFWDMLVWGALAKETWTLDNTCTATALNRLWRGPIAADSFELHMSLEAQFRMVERLVNAPSWDTKLQWTQNRGEISGLKIKFGDPPRWVKSWLRTRTRAELKISTQFLRAQWL